MEVHFIVLQETNTPKKFKLSDNEYVILGRSPKLSQVKLDDDLCSSKHCRVSLLKSKVVIEDLDSKNGVYLNGVRILKQKLYINDKAKFGKSSLYINPKRMSNEDVKICTYKGETEVRGVGNLTLELNGIKSPTEDKMPKIQNTPKIQLIKNTRAKLKQKTMTRQKATTALMAKPSEPIMSRRKIALLKYFSNLIDVLISAIIFMSFIFNFDTISIDLAKLSQENNFIKFLFLEEVIPYTGISFFISFIIYILNRRLEPASAGERILKVNKDTFQ
jgi:pSer/pThr/pTyr-binding forkhead associated (FHA) protein